MSLAAGGTDVVLTVFRLEDVDSYTAAMGRFLTSVSLLCTDKAAIVLVETTPMPEEEAIASCCKRLEELEELIQTSRRSTCMLGFHVCRLDGQKAVERTNNGQVKKLVSILTQVL